MPRNPVQALLNQARYLVLIAVAGLTVLSVATFAWAIAKTVKLFGALLDGGWRGDVALVDLLGVIEMYLLAIVQLIVAIGLYELFVGDLDVPNWLEVTSLDDLKKSIVDVLVVFLGPRGGGTPARCADARRGDRGVDRGTVVVPNGDCPCQGRQTGARLTEPVGGCRAP